jgi:hypothetical protein
MKPHTFLTILTASLALGTAVAAPVITLHTASPAGTSPVVDGKLDEACWQTLPKVTTFYSFYSTVPVPAASKTDFQLAYDDKGVYLAIRLHEPNMDKLKATITDRGSAELWMDDSAEIYFDPAATAVGFRKFVINSLGTQAGVFQLDGANVDTTWCPDGWHVATSKDDQGWYAELFFPYSVLGRTPKPGDLWRFAICRFAFTGKRLFATSAPGAKFFNPGAFGWLYFLPDAQSDPEKLGNALKDRIGGDWILPAGEKAISKEGNAVKLVSLSEPIVKGKKEAEATLAECRKQTPPEADAAPLDKIATDIQSLPLSVSDPADFGNAMLQLSTLKQSLEDYLFTQRRDEILRLNAPKPLPTPVPKPTPQPKPAASPAAPSPSPAAK